MEDGCYGWLRGAIEDGCYRGWLLLRMAAIDMAAIWMMAATDDGCYRGWLLEDGCYRRWLL